MEEIVMFGNILIGLVIATAAVLLGRLAWRTHVARPIKW
jgi:hypothetical protein